MSRTGNQVLTDLSRFIGDLDFPQGLTTTGAGGTTSLVDSALGRFGNDYINDWYIRITEDVNGNQYLNRRVSDFVASTTTATHDAFPGTTASGTTYELHRISPDEKFSAIDEARLTVFPSLGTLVYHDGLTADGRTRTFDIPSSIRRGPIDVFVEEPVEVEAEWNFLASPRGDSTTGYTATGTTATTRTKTEGDLIVPALEDTCTILTTAASQAATYNLAIASAENDLTASLAADRPMTYARKVYCTEASKVRLGITDDGGATYGSYHAGNGWELLTVEDTVAGNNATTLTAVLDIASTANPSVIAVERGWWYFGTAERVTESWAPVVKQDVRRDNTTQQFTLAFIPQRGHQLRLVGRGLLSALGTTQTTQGTATMEVDEAESELLCAEAAKILLKRRILSGAAFEKIAPQIATAEQTLKDLRSKWEQKSPGPRIKSMWSA